MSTEKMQSCNLSYNIFDGWIRLLQWWYSISFPRVVHSVFNDFLEDLQFFLREPLDQDLLGLYVIVNRFQVLN